MWSNEPKWNRVEAVPPKWSHEKKALWCCVSCTLWRVWMWLPGQETAFPGSAQSLRPFCLCSGLGKHRRLLEKCRWLSLDAAVAWEIFSSLCLIWIDPLKIPLLSDQSCFFLFALAVLLCRGTFQWNLYSIFVDPNHVTLVQKAPCAEGNCCCHCQNLTVESFPFSCII